MTRSLRLFTWVWPLAALLVTALALSAWLVRDKQPPDDATRAEFCDYWRAWELGGAVEQDAGSDSWREHAERARELGTPADASDLVREGLMLRVQFYEALGDEDDGQREDTPVPREHSLASQTAIAFDDEGDQEAWTAFTEYTTRTCQ